MRVFIILLFYVNLSIAGIKEDISKTIVRVKSGNKYSTGFFWKNGNDVVTTLHSVVGSNPQIEIYIPSLGSWKNATVKRVLKRADVVILNVEGYTSQHFISSRLSQNPILDSKVFTVGFNSSNLNYQDREFRVGLFDGRVLRDLLPLTAEQEIRNLGFPSLDSRIVYLDGHLLHGFSGSPIVDYNGDLIGIANGGLENGAASISWCISSIYLPQLETSTESLPTLNNNILRNLFTSEFEGYLPEENNKVLDFNEFQIVKLKTRTFSQMELSGHYSSEDGLGLNQLLYSFQQNGINYNDFSFDVYTDIFSGATFCVPAGLNLYREGNFLTATSSDGFFSLKILLEKTNNLQNTSLKYEYEIMPGINFNNIFTSQWQQDSAWSYLYPTTRSDGLKIIRKGFINMANSRYVFEALAGKNDTFLGVSVTMRNNRPPFNSNFNYKLNVAFFDLAVQLTTFGI